MKYKAILMLIFCYSANGLTQPISKDGQISDSCQVIVTVPNQSVPNLLTKIAINYEGCVELALPKRANLKLRFEASTFDGGCSFNMKDDHAIVVFGDRSMEQICRFNLWGDDTSGTVTFLAQ